MIAAVFFGEKLVLIGYIGENVDRGRQECGQMQVDTLKNNTK